MEPESSISHPCSHPSTYAVPYFMSLHKGIWFVAPFQDTLCLPRYTWAPSSSSHHPSTHKLHSPLLSCPSDRLSECGWLTMFDGNQQAGSMSWTWPPIGSTSPLHLAKPWSAAHRPQTYIGRRGCIKRIHHSHYLQYVRTYVHMWQWKLDSTVDLPLCHGDTEDCYSDSDKYSDSDSDSHKCDHIVQRSVTLSKL